jgi:hypothetical protein
MPGDIALPMALGLKGTYWLNEKTGAGYSPGSSPNLDTDEPILTVSKDTPIGVAYGINLLSGNLIRQNAFNEEDYILAMVDFGEGEWSDIMGHFVNGNNYWDLIDSHSKWEHLGSASQSGVTNIWSDNPFCFRNNVICEYKLKKGDGLTMLNNIQLVSRCKKVNWTGWGATKYFSRNPAAILWDWYVNIKGISSNELDANAFTSLAYYCGESCAYTDQEYYEVAVPCATSSAVKSTSYYKNQKSCRMFEYGNSAIGDFDTSGTLCWASASY